MILHQKQELGRTTEITEITEIETYLCRPFLLWSHTE